MNRIYTVRPIITVVGADIVAIDTYPANNQLE